MKISTKGRYALRMMLELALHYPEHCVSVKEIARRQQISGKYLEQIITQLNRAGVVQSIRGSHGGYRLVKEPSQYTVGSILRVVEGNLAPVACLENEENNCERKSRCVTVEVWEQVYQAVCQVVDHITLADLVRRYHEKNPEECN